MGVAICPATLAVTCRAWRRVGIKKTGTTLDLSHPFRSPKCLKDYDCFLKTLDGVLGVYSKTFKNFVLSSDMNPIKNLGNRQPELRCSVL